MFKDVGEGDGNEQFNNCHCLKCNDFNVKLFQVDRISPPNTFLIHLFSVDFEEPLKELQQIVFEIIGQLADLMNQDNF